MKATTTISIIAAVFSLQAGILFANNDNSPLPASNDASASYCIALAPSTPAEATFDETLFVSDFSVLGPVTPAEASFEESAEVLTSAVILAPVTPSTADFEDASNIVSSDIISLAPVTPAAADFE